MAYSKYRHVYSNIFGIEDLYSDVNYLFALKLKENSGENLTKLVLSALKYHIISRLRKEGPRSRSGKTSRAAVQLDLVDYNIHDNRYMAMEELALVKAKVRKLPKKYQDFFALKLTGIDDIQIAYKMGVSAANVSVYKQGLIHYLKTGEMSKIRHADPEKITVACAVCGKKKKIAPYKYRASKSGLFFCGLKHRGQYKGFKVTAEVKAKISKSSKGKVISPATRKKISAGMKKYRASQRKINSGVA